MRNLVKGLALGVLAIATACSGAATSGLDVSDGRAGADVSAEIGAADADTPAPPDRLEDLDAPLLDAETETGPEAAGEGPDEVSVEIAAEPTPEIAAEVPADASVAAPTPGSEHVVNEVVAGDQAYPAAAALTDGRFVVAFQSSASGTPRVLLRCLDAEGTPHGAEAEVDPAAPGSQERPALAAVEGGGFVVAWHAAKPADASDVVARRFDGCAAPASAAERVNEQVADAQGFASLAALPGKGFVVAWETSCAGFPCAELDGSWSGVFARRVAWAAATPIEQLVNSYTMGQQENADVAPLADGGWLVTWASLGQVGTGWDVYAQRFSPEGAKAGDEVRVNVDTDGLQSESDAALLTDGRVVVAWTSRAEDGTGGDVLARLLAADGAPEGPAFALARHDGGVQLRPAVAALPGGGFVAGWDDDTLDGAGHGVVARVFAAGAAPLADEVVQSATTADDQRLLDLAPDAHGGWLAVWASRAQDGDGWGVVARRFTTDYNGSVP